MKVVTWLLDHWYLPLFGIGVVLGWWLTRGSGKPSPLDLIKAELDGIAAVRDARELRARLGNQQAAEEVRRRHQAAVQQLDAQQAEQAAQLRDNPVALSKFLVGAARKR